MGDLNVIWYTNHIEYVPLEHIFWLQSKGRERKERKEKNERKKMRRKSFRVLDEWILRS